MGWLKVKWRQLQTYLENRNASRGYTCDHCGTELFCYPQKRLCTSCEQTLLRPLKNTCPKCGRATRAQGVCMNCKSHLPTFQKGVMPFVYIGETAGLVNRVKNGKRRLAYFFGTEMAQAFLREFPPNEKESAETLLLIPVPITKEKRRVRGYNQAEELVKQMLRCFGEAGLQAETDFDVLQKTRDSEQKQLGYAARAKNVAGAYHVHKRSVCKGRTVLLIDDIYTTGATASECASRLFRAGAKAVYFVAAAASPERK